jgi:hypothetical protein
MSELPNPQPTEFLLYETDDGHCRIDVRTDGDTVWLSLMQMVELFGRDKSVVSRHIKNIFDEGELDRTATVASHATVQIEGAREIRRHIEFYNLDVIISVGYRIKSSRGTQFRIWATQRLRDYLLKGFTLDDERLRNPPVGDSAVPDRFGELLERIRDIRSSERRMYLRVREIFALAADYSPTLPETTRFFRVIQNKLHYAVTGLTAAELIHQRADRHQPHMGLSTWSSGQVRRSDVATAKNYLREEEVIELNRVVTMWLDFAEDQALRRKEVYLCNWSDKLDAFLRVNDRPVLSGMGTVSHRQAKVHAESEYEQFARARRSSLEAEGEADLVRLLQPPSGDETSVTELGKVERRLSARKKDKGADDAA